MAFTRRYRRSKTYTKAGRKKALTIPRMKRIVYNMAENKFFDYNGSSSPVPNGAITFFSLLGQIPQQGAASAATASLRQGNKIYVSKIQIRVMCGPLNGAVVNGTCLRFGTYHNKEARKALPLATEVFNTSDPLALRNSQYFPQVSILKDITHHTVVTTQNAGTPLSSGPMGMYLIDIPVNRMIDYVSTGGGAGSATDLLVHDYGVWFISSGANSHFFNFNTKVLFKDN